MKQSISNPEGAELPAGHPPVLVLTVDTEEEFDWGAPFRRDRIEVSSVEEQRLMHEVLRPRGAVPTYLVDYPVVADPRARAFLAGLRESGECEIGAHLHPWVNPPHEEAVCPRNSFPGNLPPSLERRKLEILTEAIEEAFGVRPRCYRAGRCGIGSATLATLAKLGYHTDLSVAAHTDYSADGGPDFRGFPDRPYWTGPDGSILELPLTRGFVGVAAAVGPRLHPLLDVSVGRHLRLPGIAARTGIIERILLTPEDSNADEMIRLGKALLGQGHRVFTLSYHSPSLGIGHTPYVRDARARRRLIDAVAAFLDFFTAAGGRVETVSAIDALLRVQRAGAGSATRAALGARAVA